MSGDAREHVAQHLLGSGSTKGRRQLPVGIREGHTKVRLVAFSEYPAIDLEYLPRFGIPGVERVCAAVCPLANLGAEFGPLDEFG